MPIYEYECAKGHTFELMVSLNGEDPKTCVVAGCRSKPKRLLSASGFILKGSGWHSTDYPSETRKQGWEQESKAANGGGDAAGHSCGSGCGHGAPAENAAPPTAKPEPAAKPKVKNPYSSGQKKSKNAAKSKS